MIVQ
jgi:hypothetical protein